jgi:hypothetical protein
VRKQLQDQILQVENEMVIRDKARDQLNAEMDLLRLHHINLVNAISQLTGPGAPTPIPQISKSPSY